MLPDVADQAAQRRLPRANRWVRHRGIEETAGDRSAPVALQHFDIAQAVELRVLRCQLHRACIDIDEDGPSLRCQRRRHQAHGPVTASDIKDEIRRGDPHRFDQQPRTSVHATTGKHAPIGDKRPRPATQGGPDLRGVRPHAGASREVVAADARGHGLSDRPPHGRQRRCDPAPRPGIDPSADPPDGAFQGVQPGRHDLPPPGATIASLQQP